ncbi:S-layer homology domain-containing protein [Paenibacillus amylolyticus]|uniref:S-layer homology domain-containing protein n=1 Tax=Paenibacillus amylolyticus TaxID=1451 RepID=UPI0033908586
MRNTSDPIKKENSNVMNAQGGEKKVMKKILSVALSTAMAFSMFASVAFGDTAVSPQQQFDALKAKGIFNGYPDGTAGLDKDMTRAEFAKVITKLLGLKEITGTLSYTDKNYTAKNWAVPYIEAVTAAGIMEGKNVEKKIFDFNGKVTVSEMATILTRALDLEIPAETNNTAPAWAKGYVQAAINAGLVDANTNFTANASRELLVGAAYSIDQAQSLKVSSYTVTEGGKVVEFKISDGETVKVTLDKALEANKETEVKFTYKDKNFTEKVTYVVEAATKVQSASSTNLKEVDVAFDGKVDKATATDKANYTVDAGSRAVKSVTLLEDGKTVRVLLDTTSKGRFSQGTTYKVLVKNVKSSTGTVVPQGEVSFTSADNTLPTVTEVKALGTKVIKVTFSEPIKTPTSSNFQLDDKAYVGSVTLGANEREVILRDYTGTIAEGAHKLTTSLVEDYAGLKSLSATTDFTAAVDTEGPKVTEITATLEKVTVTFDEEIDPQALTSESFYWLSGTTKKTGKATQISGNVYEVDFTENRLPGYETTLYVDVKDYSGNVNSTKEHKVTASVDLVQPKLIDASYGTEVANQLTVRFDKAVDAADIKHFTVNKGSDVIPVKNVTPAPGSDNKVFNVEFYSNLSGTYTLKVSGVQDRTALKNTMVNYEGTFVASDSAAPALNTTSGIDVNNANKTVALTFDREIDLATLNNKANYYIGFKKTAGGVTQNISLPVDVGVNVSNNGKTVVLVFPETINGTNVSFPSSVESVSIAGLKSKTGQATGYITTGIIASADLGDLSVNSGTRKDARTIEVVFNKTIANASASDFSVAGTSVSSASVDGNKVTLKTNSDIAAGSAVNILAGNGIQSFAGKRIAATPVLAVGDVSPKVDESLLPSSKVLNQVNRKVVIPFTTNLDDANEADVATNLLVKRADKPNSGDELRPKQDYSTVIEGNTVVVTFLDDNDSDVVYIVSVKDNATFIRNAADTSKVAGKSAEYRTTGNSTVADSVTGTAQVTTAAATAINASATVAGLKLEAKTAGEAGNAINVEIAHDGVLNSGVVVTADKITVEAGLANEVDAIVAAVQAKASDATIPYTASKIDNSAPTTTFNFEGGKDAVEGEVTITLNKAITSITEVKIGGVPFTAKFAGTSKSTILVDTNNEAVAGKTVVVTATDANNLPITVTTIVAAN